MTTNSARPASGKTVARECAARRMKTSNKLKTEPNDACVDALIEAVSNPTRRQDATTLLAMGPC